MSGARTDADIQRDVLESLYWDTRVDAARIAVTVQDGQVRLAGAVPTYRARAAAEQDARVVRGVEHVDNRVEVEISPLLETPTDENLAQAVTDVLAADPDLRAVDIEVTVADGRVRLTGTTPTFWERELARSLVTVLPGVRAVSNELVAAPPGDHTDTDLARRVMGNLRRHRHVDPTTIDVAVEHGRVVVTGTVPDETVRQHVLDGIRTLDGVVDIDDRLTVPAPTPPDQPHPKGETP